MINEVVESDLFDPMYLTNEFLDRIKELNNWRVLLKYIEMIERLLKDPRVNKSEFGIDNIKKVPKLKRLAIKHLY